MKKPGNRRKTGVEQYYTPKRLAAELTEILIKTTGTDRDFLEPAGGNGSFVQALQNQSVRSIQSVDLHPKHPQVSRADFLTFTPLGKDLVTISNPPFGRNNALSIPFFNRAADSSEYIAFLVPRSWRKWSVINRLDRRFHIIEDLDVQVNYVTEDDLPIGKQNNLRTCFQIWKKQDSLRSVVKIEDRGLIQKTSPQDADLAIRVFGYGCGQVLRDFPKTPNTTLMFLKVLNSKVFEVIEGLDYERFTLNTAYTKALSMPELNFLLNEAVFGDPLIKSED